MCKKAGIKRGIMKTVFESYSKFRTPVNFQLLGKKKWENGQWKVLLSDGLWKHVIVMSAKYDYVMNKVRRAGQLHSLFEPDLQPQDEEKCAKKEAEDPSCDQLLCAKRAAGQLQSDWTSEDIVAVELIGCPAKLQL